MNQKTYNLLLKARAEAAQLSETLNRARAAPGGLTGIWIRDVLQMPALKIKAALSDVSLTRFQSKDTNDETRNR